MYKRLDTADKLRRRLNLSAVSFYVRAILYYAIQTIYKILIRNKLCLLFVWALSVWA
jgi:hypothetical protein